MKPWGCRSWGFIREEWGVGSGEWGVGNGEWGMGNGEWGMGNGERENTLLPTPYSLLPTSVLDPQHQHTRRDRLVHLRFAVSDYILLRVRCDRGNLF